MTTENKIDQVLVKYCNYNIIISLGNCKSYLQLATSQTRELFYAKYVIRRRSSEWCAFWGFRSL